MYVHKRIPFAFGAILLFYYYLIHNFTFPNGWTPALGFLMIFVGVVSAISVGLLMMKGYWKVLGTLVGLPSLPVLYARFSIPGALTEPLDAILGSAVLVFAEHLLFVCPLVYGVMLVYFGLTRDEPATRSVSGAAPARAASNDVAGVFS